MVHVCSSLPCFTVWSEVFSLSFHITYTKWWGLPTYERSLFYLSTTLKMFLAACWGLNRKCGNRLLERRFYFDRSLILENMRELSSVGSVCALCICEHMLTKCRTNFCGQMNVGVLETYWDVHWVKTERWTIMLMMCLPYITSQDTHFRTNSNTIQWKISDWWGWEYT